MRCLIALNLACACHGPSCERGPRDVEPKGRVDDAAPANDTIPANKEPSTRSHPSLTWKRHVSELLGLEIDVLADQPVFEIGEGENVGFSQQGDGVGLGISAGPMHDLASWRARLPPVAKVNAEIAVEACWRPARRLEAVLPPSNAVGITRGADGEPQHMGQQSTPGMTHVVVALKHLGRPVLLIWVVETDRRAVYRSAEDHFFSSLACHDPTSR